MNPTLAEDRRTWSETEIEGLPEDGHTHEVVNGDLVMSRRDGEDLLPGFRYPVVELFKEWEW